MTPKPNFMRNLLLPVLLTTPLALAFAPIQPSVSTQDPAAEEEPTPLQAAMTILQTSQRKLRKLIKDPMANKQALTEVLDAMEAALLVGIQHPPEISAGTSVEEHSFRNVHFKRAMVSTLDTLLEMQLATLAGDAEALGAKYKDLSQHKKSGHDEFQ